MKFKVHGLAGLFTLLFLLSGLLLASSNVSAAVLYQAAGTAVNGTTTTGIGANPAWPAHVINDVALLFVESTGGQPVTLSVPNGFVQVANTPQATGTGTVGTQLTVFWARATSTTMPAPRIATPSDHFYARIITFRGVTNTGDPIDATSGGVKATASGSVTLSDLTTTVTNALIVQAVARDNDSTAAAFSAQTNANLTGIAERLDAGTTNGNGGGLGVWTGVKAAAGSIGNTTANVSNSINAFITIALKPQAGVKYQAVGTGVGGTGAVTPAWPAHLVDDIALLFVESTGGQAATLSTAAGFVEVPGSPQASGATTAGTRLTVFWARATSAAMSAPTVADAGDHVYARIVTYRNAVNSGNPWNVTGGGVKTPATNSVSVAGVTTTVANTLIVQAVSRDNDSANAAFSAYTNANLVGIVERSDAGTNRGNGGGVAVWDGAMATAGATGNTTANVTPNTINAYLTIALVAAGGPAPTYRAIGGAVSTGLNWPAHLTGDIALLFVESPGGQDVTLADAAGFSPVLNSPQATGGGTNGTQITVFWARATSAAMPGPTLSGPTDHAYAQILTYRGVINTGNPWDVTGGGTKAGPSTSVTVSGVTTTVPNTLVVQVASRDNDSTAAAFGTKTSGTLTGIAERTDRGTATGNGGGFAVWDGAKAAAGATGNTTVTVTSSRNAFLTIALRPPAAGPDHYELSLPTASVACLASTVAVTACADASSPCTSKYAAASGTTATLATTAGALGATTVIFDATGTAYTTLSYPAAADGATVTVTLSGESLTASNLRQCCPDGVGCAVANSCATGFKTAGFILSAAADDVAATIPTQVAGTTSSTYYLRAVKTSTTTKACESALSGANTVNFAYECNNPATCYGANLMSVNGGTATTIARNNNGSVLSYTSVDMTFDANGNAPFTFNYNDVGQVKLHANKAASGVLLTTLAGSSNAFVVKPYGFVLSGIEQTAVPQFVNPAAADAAGDRFVKAGEQFTVTVTAVTSSGGTAYNYGKETAAESVKLTNTLVAPLDCDGNIANDPDCQNPSLVGTFNTFANGVASGTAFTWGEVGIIKLTPTVADADYLGVGDVTGTVSANVGRFYPAHFNTTITAASVMPCPTGMTCPCPPTATCPPSLTRFVYSSQPFTADVYARNVANQATRNYYAAFAKAVTLSAVDAEGGVASPVGSITAATNTVNASAFLSGTTGVGTQAAPVYVFTALPTVPTDVHLRAIESAGDGVSSLRDPASTSWEQGIKVVSGRVKVANAYGSELLPLAMRASVQLYNATGSWVTSDTDTVTTIAASDFALAFPVATANKLAACETALSITGSSPVFNVNLSAPGTGNNGWTDLTLNLGAVAAGNSCTAVGGAGALSTTANRPWLQYPVGTNPVARGTFGVYGGNNTFIYQRENY